MGLGLKTVASPETKVLVNSFKVVQPILMVLDAQNPGAAFQWSTGETTQTIVVSAPDTFSVSVNSGGVCTTTDSIIVNFNPPPLVQLGPDISVCSGATVTLDAGNPGLDYLWSTMEFTQTIQPTTSDTYWVEVSDNGGCPGRDTISVTFVPNPVVALGNDTILCGGRSNCKVDSRYFCFRFHCP